MVALLHPVISNSEKLTPPLLYNHKKQQNYLFFDSDSFVVWKAIQLKIDTLLYDLKR